MFQAYANQCRWKNYKFSTCEHKIFTTRDHTSYLDIYLHKPHTFELIPFLKKETENPMRRSRTNIQVCTFPKKHATERGNYTVITQCPPIQRISTCLLAERAQLSSHPACVLSASLLQGRRRSRGLYRDKPQISCSPGARCRDMRKLKQTCSAPSAKWDELSFLCSEVPSPSLIAQEVQSASDKRRGR